MEKIKKLIKYIEKKRNQKLIKDLKKIKEQERKLKDNG